MMCSSTENRIVDFLLSVAECFQRAPRGTESGAGTFFVSAPQLALVLRLILVAPHGHFRLSCGPRSGTT